MQNEPDTLEMLFTAGSDSNKAFVTILLASLRRLEQGVDNLGKKLDAVEDGHARDVAGIGSRFEGMGARLGGVESRLSGLEQHVAGKGEGNWRYVQAMLFLLSGLGTIVALLKH